MVTDGRNGNDKSEGNKGLHPLSIPAIVSPGSSEYILKIFETLKEKRNFPRPI
jgi:hypothetical protein